MTDQFSYSTNNKLPGIVQAATMSLDSPHDGFAEEVRRLRADYMVLRNTTRFTSDADLPILDLRVEMVKDIEYTTYWYDDGTPQGQCIQLAAIPGTLSGDILRLRQDLPVLKGDHIITGNQVCPLQDAPKLPGPLEDDSEDLTAAFTSLPLIEVDLDKHFVKKGKYESEIKNLLKCQGGSCPGTPISRHIIQLLGKSSDGRLVFERFQSRYITQLVDSLCLYKSWILQLIAGLQRLHSLGIIHRDLRIDNLLWSRDYGRLLICDLEGRWGNRSAPEVILGDTLEAGWTEKSDIYDIGNVIKGIVYANVPMTHLVEWPIPPPLDAIVEACTCDLPQDRPTLDELHDMVDAVQVAGYGEKFK